MSEVRILVLRDVQRAFGGKDQYAAFLSSGARSAGVLRGEIERLVGRGDRMDVSFGY